jgi:peroxidase
MSIFMFWLGFQIIGSLEAVYSTVDDIDLYIGCIYERSVAGGYVGPTFACVIGDQFSRLKHGDRFFYENSEGPAAFTPGKNILV